MKSPRFDLRAPELKKVIDASRLQATWKRLRPQMRKEQIPDPLDFLDFHSAIVNESYLLERRVFQGNYSASRPTRYLAEKSKGLCRQLVIPQVRDALILQCLSDAFWVDIKGKAPSKNAFFAMADHSFSTLDVINEYNSLGAWLQFQKKIFQFSKARNFVVVTDIANYYDSIRYDQLRNTIAGIVDVRESVLDFLIFVLSELLWQPDYMPRIEVGLPQLNFDAPRLLAHCFLFELDKVVTSHKDIEYVRYMDDIDVGTDEVHTAKSILKKIDLALHSRHLRLNSGKTLILSAKQAMRHFKVRENIWLDRLDAKLKTAPKAYLAKAIVSLPRIMIHALRAGIFSDGNGDKVLKRSISICSKYGFVLPDEVIDYILYRRPSVRSAVFRWFGRTNFNHSTLRRLITYVLSADVVDDATVIDFANALVDCKITSVDAAAKDEIVKFANEAAKAGTSGVYAALWVLAKYGTEADILAFLKVQKRSLIANHLLSRLVGAMYSRIESAAGRNWFRVLLKEIGDSESLAAAKFHDDLQSDVVLINTVRPILQAPDISKPNGLSLQKLLAVNSVKQCKAFPPHSYASLMSKHVKFKQDYFLQKILS